VGTVAKLVRKSRPEPRGAERFTLAYLGIVFAAAGAGLLGVVAQPVATAAGVCAVDPTDGFCMPFFLGGLGLILFWALLVPVAWFFCFGGMWVLWTIAIQLVAVELAVQFTVLIWPMIFVVILAPGTAALITNPRPVDPNGVEPVWPPRVKAGLLVVAGLQFLAWSVVFMLG
jgi:hypothetical protein